LKICDKVRQSAIASNEHSHESDSPALDQGTIIRVPLPDQFALNSGKGIALLKEEP